MHNPQKIASLIDEFERLNFWEIAERRHVLKQLASLTGRNLGAEPDEWRRWFEVRRRRLAEIASNEERQLVERLDARVTTVVERLTEWGFQAVESIRPDLTTRIEYVALDKFPDELEIAATALDEAGVGFHFRLDDDIEYAPALNVLTYDAHFFCRTLIRIDTMLGSPLEIRSIKRFEPEQQGASRHWNIDDADTWFVKPYRLRPPTDDAPGLPTEGFALELSAVSLDDQPRIEIPPVSSQRTSARVLGRFFDAVNEMLADAGCPWCVTCVPLNTSTSRYAVIPVRPAEMSAVVDWFGSGIEHEYTTQHREGDNKPVRDLFCPVDDIVPAERRWVGVCQPGAACPDVYRSLAQRWSRRLGIDEKEARLVSSDFDKPVKKLELPRLLEAINQRLTENDSPRRLVDLWAPEVGRDRYRIGAVDRHEIQQLHRHGHLSDYDTTMAIPSRSLPPSPRPRRVADDGTILAVSPGCHQCRPLCARHQTATPKRFAKVLHRMDHQINEGFVEPVTPEEFKFPANGFHHRELLDELHQAPVVRTEYRCTRCGQRFGMSVHLARRGGSWKPI